jgi:5-methyltetrahydrofolate--homocysteine methyltransferase
LNADTNHLRQRAVELGRLLRERIVILDGAMGTMVQQHQLSETDYRGDRFKESRQELKGLHDLLSLTQPALVERIHPEYLEAGADIIETNTFNAQALSLADYGLSSLAYELNLAAGQCARRAVDKVMAAQPGRICCVGGALGPTNKTTSISTDVQNAAARGATFDQVAAAYYDQARGLLDGGVDLLLVETIFDTPLVPRPDLAFDRSVSPHTMFLQCSSIPPIHSLIGRPFGSRWPGSHFFERSPEFKRCTTWQDPE